MTGVEALSRQRNEIYDSWIKKSPSNEEQVIQQHNTREIFQHKLY